MVRDHDIIDIFHSIHRIMKAEKVLKKAGIDVLLVPTPRQLSSDCGLALRYSPESAARVAEVLQENGLPPAVERYQYRAGVYTPLPL